MTCGAKDYDSCVEELNEILEAFKKPLIPLRKNASDYEKYYACIGVEKQIQAIAQAHDREQARTLYDLTVLRLPSLSDMDSTAMVLVPAGEFEMDGGYFRPKHRIFVDAYYIGVFCVTVRQYAKFVKETGYDSTCLDWFNHPGCKLSSFEMLERMVSATKEELNAERDGIYDFLETPVCNVSWSDAMAYATWAGGTLPTEAQWEKAARGPQNFDYPWGNEWDANKCRNASNSGEWHALCQVAEYLSGMSGYGTFNQSGNVDEWCADWYEKRDYKLSPGPNPKGPASGIQRVIKGGSSVTDYEDFFRASFRGQEMPSKKSMCLGFRIAKKA